jgi:hypothetical protein
MYYSHAVVIRYMDLLTLAAIKEFEWPAFLPFKTPKVTLSIMQHSSKKCGGSTTLHVVWIALKMINFLMDT